MLNVELKSHRITRVRAHDLFPESFQCEYNLCSLRMASNDEERRHKFVCLFNLLESVLILATNLNLNEYNLKP